MKRLITICLVGGFILAMIARTAGAACVGYTVQSNGDDNLYSIDLMTGDYTRIGPVGYGDVEGLAFDSKSGMLYGVEGTGGHVIKIDPITGVGTLVGTCSLAHIDTGAAIDPETDKLYAINAGSGDSKLYEISKTTGSETLLASYDDVFGDSLAIGPGHVAYTVDAIYSDSLYMIDLTAPSNIIPVGPLGMDVLDQSGLARCPTTNQYYMLLWDGGLYGVDTTTGLASLIANTVADCEGLAIIPEPATVCLLGLGALSLLHRKRRV